MTTQLHAGTGGRTPRGEVPVVLLHGAGGNHMQWTVMARTLAGRGHDVLAFDLPGHGRSAGPAATTVDAYADAVLADLDARSVDRFAVAGHSMGAMIALRLAASAPERVQGLALIGAGLALQVSPALLDATRDDPLLAARAIIDWGHSPSSHLGAGAAPGVWLDGADLALLRAEIEAHPGSLHADFSATAAYDGHDDAARVEGPTLVVSGGRDNMTPAKLGRAAAAAIPGADYLELDDCGHMLMTERPVELAAALVAWADRTTKEAGDQT